MLKFKILVVVSFLSLRTTVRECGNLFWEVDFFFMNYNFVLCSDCHVAVAPLNDKFDVLIKS